MWCVPIVGTALFFFPFIYTEPMFIFKFFDKAKYINALQKLYVCWCQNRCPCFAYMLKNVHDVQRKCSFVQGEMIKSNSLIFL
jgi:hypothetical protein